MQKKCHLDFTILKQDDGKSVLNIRKKCEKHGVKKCNADDKEWHGLLQFCLEIY